MGVQNRNAPDIKFSVAEMDVICRLLSLQNADECCAIKELRKTSVWKQRKNWESAQVSGLVTLAFLLVARSKMVLSAGPSLLVVVPRLPESNIRSFAFACSPE